MTITINKFAQLIMCAALTIGLAACGDDGRDGVDGSNGIDGTNGVDGVDGTNGIDGQNGEDGRDLTNPDLATYIDLGPFDCTEEELTNNADKNCRLYIKGSMNNWSSRPEAELTHQGNGVYIALFTISPGDYSFKISDQDWSAERDLAIGSDADAAVVFDTAMTLQRKFTDTDGTEYSNQNMSISVTGDEDQTFRFTLDASATINNPTLTIENISETDVSNLTKSLYLIGSFNNDSAHEDFLFNYVGAGGYQVLVSFDEAQYINFRVQQGDEYGNKYGSLKDTPLTLTNGDSVLTTTPGGEITAEVEAGVYVFSLSMLGDGQLGVPISMQKVRATAGHDQLTVTEVASNLTSDGSLFAETFAWETTGVVNVVLRPK